MSPAQLEATADLNVHDAAREEGGAEPVEPEVWGHHHMSRGKPSVEHLADKHRHPEMCHGPSDSVPENTSGLETCSALVSM